MKIDYLCNDGSPLGVSLATLLGNDPNQIGTGGAEAAMLTLCEEWTKAGHQVRLYNDPRQGWDSPFEQLPIETFNSQDDRDVLIVFRSPNLRMIDAKGLKVWFSCDQNTVGDFSKFRPMVDKVVCISPRHAQYFAQTYGINDGIVIDLPVRVSEYENRDIEKVKNRFIFTSVPSRGLDVLLDMWPKLKREIPDASLVVTSDYRLWSHLYGRDNENFVRKAFSLEDVFYLSAVPRPKLVEEQLKAEIHLYPCEYDELFCIAIAESQVAGAYTITSDYGSLSSTNMMKVINGEPRRMIGEYVSDAKKFIVEKATSSIYVKEMQEKAKIRFHPDTILKEWNKKVFNG